MELWGKKSTSVPERYSSRISWAWSFIKWIETPISYRDGSTLPTPARNEAFYYRQSHFPPRTYQDKYTANTLCPCSLTTTDRKVSLMNKLSDLSPLPNATASSYHPPKVLQVFDNQSQFHGWCMVLRCFGSFFSFLFFLFSFHFLLLPSPMPSKVGFIRNRLEITFSPDIVLGNSSFRKFSTSIEDRRSFSLASISLQRE